MFRQLQIENPYERWLVALADRLLAIATAPAKLVARRGTGRTPRRVLLLRLERIGDLLMVREAIAEVRRLAPQATIDLVVGSWNASLARLFGEVDRVETLDAPWLARGDGKGSPLAFARCGLQWRRRAYDLGINFEGDIRSHLLLALCGCHRRVGFEMAGGGPLLTERVPHDPRQHVAWNALRLVYSAFPARSVSEKREHAPSRAAPPAKSGHNSDEHSARSALLGAREVLPGRARSEATPQTAENLASGWGSASLPGFSHSPAPRGLDISADPNLSQMTQVSATEMSSDDRRAQSNPSRLNLPQGTRTRVQALLAAAGSSSCIAVHVAAGRAIKQWPPERFAEVARHLAHVHGATIVLTGSIADRPLVEKVKTHLGESAASIDLAGQLDLVTLAAVFERCALVVTGDSGPMHLAAAVGAPVVAIFGPSDPTRYAPLTALSRIVHVDLPCSPCNRIRRPPTRCVGHTPDCLAAIDVTAVIGAATELLREAQGGMIGPASPVSCGHGPEA